MAILNGHRLLVAMLGNPNDHQQVETVIRQADIAVCAVRPTVHLALVAQVATLPVLVLIQPPGLELRIPCSPKTPWLARPTGRSGPQVSSLQPGQSGREWLFGGCLWLSRSMQLVLDMAYSFSVGAASEILVRRSTAPPTKAQCFKVIGFIIWLLKERRQQNPLPAASLLETEHDNWKL